MIKVCCNKQKSAKNHSANQLNQFSDNSRKDFNNDYDDVLDMFQLTPNTNSPLKVTLLVNHTPITMEIDTGASTSLINHDTFIKLFGSASKLTSTSSRIRTYTGEVVKPIGEAELEFTYNNQKAVSCYNYEG